MDAGRAALEPFRAEVLGAQGERRRRDRPRRSARRSAATMTPIRPVRWPAIRAARTRTPSPSAWSDERRAPAPSRPPSSTSWASHAEPGQPAGGVGGRPALADADRARARRCRSRAAGPGRGRRRGRGRRGRARGASGSTAPRRGWYRVAYGAGPRPQRRGAMARDVGTIPPDEPPDPRPRTARDQHDPDPLDRRRPEGQLGPSRAPRWAPRRWPTCSGRASCATPRRDPDWPDRDRFVLSAGHASMLLYSLLHLTGYDVTLDDLKSFRQWGSRTPGHPEYGLTAGRRGDHRAARPGLRERGRHGDRGATPGRRVQPPRPRRSSTTGRSSSLSDGDLQEGIASEAASLAGHLRLGKLVVLYDDNHIQLDGPTDMAWSEDVLERFDAYGWHTSARRGRQRPRRPSPPRSGPRSLPSDPRSSRSGRTSASAAPIARTPRRRTARRSARTRSA